MTIFSIEDSTSEGRENLNMVWGTLIVDELIRNGITYFCISPGSRSTPLTVQAARHPQARSLVCYDERGAGFHALGYARATGRPAALISTSGTAVANYFPAVVEAFQDRIPLLILSADRPPELRETGANQTIHQPGIFGDYTRWTFDIPCPDERISPSAVLTTVDQAVYQSLRSPKGPVHLNCMFREPLEPSPDPVSDGYLQPVSKWMNHTLPFTNYSRTTHQPDENAVQSIVDILNHTERGLLVVGRLNSSVGVEAVKEFAGKLNWPVIADVLSGLRLGVRENLPICYNQLLFSEKFNRQMDVQTVLHLGSPLTAKHYLRYIERHPPANYIQVSDHSYRHDPAAVVTHRLESTYQLFCQQLRPLLSPKINAAWRNLLLKKSQSIRRLMDETLMAQEIVSEPAVARAISRTIPGGHGLFLASSLPVREMDWFADYWGASVKVAGNRGASGIDGTIATASGFARGLNRPVTLLTGDLAFLHDLNSLSQLKDLDRSLVIVLLNNDGGGIFNFLPIARFKAIFEPFFATPHGLNFAPAARLFGVEYHKPSSMKRFSKLYEQATKKKNHTIIEIKTNRDENYKLHQHVKQYIINILESDS